MKRESKLIVKKEYFISKFIYFIINFFRIPKNKKYIIVNPSGSEILFKNKYISKNECFIIDFNDLIFSKKNNEKNNHSNVLNFWILFFGLIKNPKLFIKSKYAWFVVSSAILVRPKFIITYMDYVLHFYLAKNYYNKSRYISIQVGRRSSEPGAFFELLKKISKQEKLRCDYIFTYNKNHANFYKKYIDTDAISSGSIRSNSYKILNEKKIEDSLLFISQFRNPKITNVFMKFNEVSISHLDFYKSELELLKLIIKYCKKNNFKLKILSAATLKHRMEDEIIFYNKHIGKENYEMLEKKYIGHSYHLTDKFKYVCGINSTLLYEALGRGSRVGLFYIRGEFIPSVKNVKFGWPYDVNESGIFWTHKFSYQEVSRIIGNLINLSEKEWINNTKNIIENVMLFDKDNVKLRSILNN